MTNTNQTKRKSRRATTLAEFTRNLEQLGETVTVTRANGETFQAYVVSSMHIEGLQTVTVGYCGVASDLYKRDHPPVRICAKCRAELTSMRGVLQSRDGAYFHGRCWRNV